MDREGCGSCHTFEPANAHMPMGPDLQLSLQGKSRDYVRESIVLPSKSASPGWGTGAMPEDYAQRIAPATSMRSSTSSSTGCARPEFNGSDEADEERLCNPLPLEKSQIA